MFEAVNLIRDFLDSGGEVLYPIMFVLFLMWTLILERVWYFWREHPARAKEAAEKWDARQDHESWYAQQIRRRLISEL